MTTPKTSLLHDVFQGLFAVLLFAANAVYFTSEPKTFLGTALFIGLAAFLLYPILVSCFNLVTRTNWAQGKRKTAGETLSKDITWLC